MKNKKLWILCLLVLAQTAFIWCNSMASVEDSGAFSGGIMLFIKNFIDPGDRLDPEFFHHIIRKTAHFTEFFLLGMLYTFVRRQIHFPKRASFALLAPFAGLFTAVCDEWIQSYTGRGSSVRDVMLDFAGVLCAVVVVEMLFCLRIAKADKSDD